MKKICTRRRLKFEIFLMNADENFADPIQDKEKIKKHLAQKNGFTKIFETDIRPDIFDDLKLLDFLINRSPMNISRSMWTYFPTYTGPANYEIDKWAVIALNGVRYAVDSYEGKFYMYGSFYKLD